MDIRRKKKTDLLDNMTQFVPDRKANYVKVPPFRGPIKVVKNVAGKGRGVIATEEIKPGQLLIVSRAIGMDFGHDRSPSLETAVAKKLSGNPSLCQQVYKLHAGKQLGHISQSSNKKIPTKIFREIYGPDNNSYRLKMICQINHFESPNGSKGLWILPSYINHDCIDFNCVFICLGNILFIRAVTTIRKGEEILHHYTDPTEPYEERKKFFDRHDFSCGCALCSYQAKEDQTTRNRELYICQRACLLAVEKLNGEEDKIKRYIGKLNCWVGELEGMGVAGGEPQWNFSICYLFKQLRALYLKDGDVKMAKVAAEKYYDVVNGCKFRKGSGEKICFDPEAARWLVDISLKLGDLNEARNWIGALKKDLQFLYGKSDVFKFLDPDLYLEATKCGIVC